jgi:hypothetical protein
MFKSIKEKLLSTITVHLKLVTFVIGLAITFVVGAAVKFGFQIQEAHGATALIASLVVDQADARPGLLLL